MTLQIKITKVSLYDSIGKLHIIKINVIVV